MCVCVGCAHMCVMCVHVCACVCLHTFMFFFGFCSLILRGDPLSQRLLFWGPTESLQHTHTHTVTHNTITSNHKQSRLIIHTHTVWSVATLFFQVIQGCRAGFEPKTSHNSCSASSLKLPLSHPCTPSCK